MVAEGHPSLEFHGGGAEGDVMRRDKTEEQTHDLQTTRTQRGSEIEIDSMPNTAPFSQWTPVNILSHLLALGPHGTVTKKILSMLSKKRHTGYKSQIKPDYSFCRQK